MQMRIIIIRALNLGVWVMKRGRLSVALLLSVLLQTAYGGPSDKVFTPGIGYGECELGVKYGAASPLAGKRAAVASAGFGCGVRENWFTELTLKQSRGVQNATLAEWENKFMLVSSADMPLEVGLLTELEIAVSGKAASEIRVGPLLQSASGRWQFNGNVLFERAFGGVDEDGLPFVTNLAYQWQVKYRWRDALEFGAQGFGGVGQWNNWAGASAQNHRVGPAVFGEIALDDGHAVKYNAAWLFGAGAAAPNHTFRLNLEYEF